MKLAIIADDFTGANDTGVQFAKKGLNTVVTTNICEIPKSFIQNEVIVFDTESRFDDKVTAYEKSKFIASKIKENKVELLYKKIDSTLRGNIGAELAGTMDGFDCHLLILIPALPSNQRITKDGNVIVHGELLHKTEVARDPKTPVKESFIPHIIAEQCDKKTRVISKNNGFYDPQFIHEQIEMAKKDGKEILIFDADSNEDLKQLALCLYQLGGSYILAGTAGLAEFLPQSYHLVEEKPILAIIGSVSQISRAQVERAEAQGKINVIDLKIEKLLNTDYQDEIVQKAINNINKGKNIALYSARNLQSQEEAKILAKALHKSNTEICDQIAKALGYITKHVLDETFLELGYLFITGGDTLIKIGNALDIAGMVIKDEVLPAIPVGYFIHERYEKVKVITKAGAFGDENTLEKIIDYKG